MVIIMLCHIEYSIWYFLVPHGVLSDSPQRLISITIRSTTPRLFYDVIWGSFNGRNLRPNTDREKCASHATKGHGMFGRTVDMFPQIPSKRSF